MESLGNSKIYTIRLAWSHYIKDSGISNPDCQYWSVWSIYIYN